MQQSRKRFSLSITAQHGAHQTDACPSCECLECGEYPLRLCSPAAPPENNYAGPRVSSESVLSVALPIGAALRIVALLRVRCAAV